MSINFLSRRNISCCLRADVDGVKQPPYFHECGCPDVYLVCQSVQRNVSLCGFPEASGYESTPPVMYRVLTSTCGGTYVDYYTTQEDGCCCSGATYEQRIGNGSGTTTYDAVDCTTVTTDAEDGPHYTLQRWDCPLTYDESGEPPYDPIWTHTQRYDPALRINKTIEWTGTPESAIKKTSEDAYGITMTNILSSPDADADAIDRATPMDGESCSSVSEIRSSGISWIVRTSKYALVARKLMIGAEYTVRVQIDSRPAFKSPGGGDTYVDAEGEPSVWASDSDEDALEPEYDEYTFTATSREMVVPETGEWDDSDENGNINYGEVTALIELPHEVGWEYRARLATIELALGSS